MRTISRSLVLLFLLCMLMVPAQLVSGQKKDPSDSTKPEQNALVAEMLAHDSAFGKIVSAVALSDSKKVHQAIVSMHGSMDKTLEAVRTGVIVLPKNSARVSDFIDMDRKFRTKLEALDRAALHHNQREMQRITNLLLSSCVNCHQTYRK